MTITLDRAYEIMKFLGYIYHGYHGLTKCPHCGDYSYVYEHYDNVYIRGCGECERFDNALYIDSVDDIEELDALTTIEWLYAKELEYEPPLLDFSALATRLLKGE